jgi:hypothetical protein
MKKQFVTIMLKKIHVFRSLRVLLAAPALFVVLVPPHAGATTISFNPAPTTSVGYNHCDQFPANCKTRAYFDATSLDTESSGSVSNLFTNAFDAWKSSTPGGLLWTDSVGSDPGGKFNVDIATACQFAGGGSKVCNSGVTKGGLTIDIKLDGLKLPDLGEGDQLVWVQGLLENYAIEPGGPIITPRYAMDTSTLSGLPCGGTTGVACPPAYPYQYPDNSFYDQPKEFYFPPGATQGFFDANAYLAVENRGNQTLELLDGVSYGFQNYVTATPEPTSLLLFGSGLISLAGVVRKRLRAGGNQQPAAHSF